MRPPILLLVVLLTAVASSNISTSFPTAAVGHVIGYEALDACVVPRESRRPEHGVAPAQIEEQGRAPGVQAPVRTIRDPYPAFAAIAVDPVRDRIVVTDEIVEPHLDACGR